MNELVKMFDEQPVRTVENDGQVYFVAKDVAMALGYSNPQKAVRDHCKRGERFVHPLSNGQELVNIPESDVYRLCLRSKLPSAERFEAWVTEVVLPSIRKSGGYIANEEAVIDQVAAKVMDGINDRITELCKPKRVAFASLNFYNFTELGRLCTPYLHPWEVARLLESRGIIRSVPMPETGGAKIGWIPTEKAIGFCKRTSTARGRKSLTGEFVPSVKWLPSVLGIKDDTDL